MLNTEWVRKLNHAERWSVATMGTVEQVANVLKTSLPVPESLRLCSRRTLDYEDTVYLLTGEEGRRCIATKEEMQAVLLRIT